MGGYPDDGGRVWVADECTRRGAGVRCGRNGAKPRRRGLTGSGGSAVIVVIREAPSMATVISLATGVGSRRGNFWWREDCN